MAIPLATRTRNSSKLRAKLGRRRANNTRLFRSIIAAGEYRFRRPVHPRERERAIIDTAFCLEPPNCFLDACKQLRRVLRILRETQGHLRAGHILRRESVPPAPLPQVAVHRQAAHVVRARVAESQTSSQGHEGDHRPR